MYIVGTSTAQTRTKRHGDEITLWLIHYYCFSEIFGIIEGRACGSLHSMGLSFLVSLLQKLSTH